MDFCEVSFGDFVPVADGFLSRKICHIHLEMFS